MTCREFHEVVHEYVRMELLDAGLRKAVLEHAAHCSHCAARMSAAEMLAESTEALAESVREQQAPRNVEIALLAAFRNRHRRVAWWRTLEWVAAGAAAAILLIALWTSGSHPTQQPSPEPGKGISSQSKAPLDAAGPSAQPEGVAESAETQVANADANGTYTLTDFVPVPFTDAIGPEDPGMVVRVQLTRSSLAELGYPVAEMPDEGWIRADVLVGEDGWPRGVRLAR